MEMQPAKSFRDLIVWQTTTLFLPDFPKQNNLSSNAFQNNETLLPY